MSLAPIFRFFGESEINLSLKLVYAADVHAQLVTERKPATTLSADEASLRLVENVEVIRQRGHVDEAGNERVRKFDDEAVIPHVDDARVEDLRIARIDLPLEKFHLFQIR